MPKWLVPKVARNVGFGRRKKSHKTSAEDVDKPLGVSASSCTSDTSDERRERETFLDGASTVVKVSPLFRGSAVAESPVSIELTTSCFAEEPTVQGCDGVVAGDDSEIIGKDPTLAAGGDEVQFTDKDDYGQRHPIENPGLIAKRLVAFDAAVDKLPPKKRAALERAKVECPQLLDEGFKLMFLRCECFHVKRAATRCAKYWDRRLSVFGPKKAFLPLTLEGALKDDEVALSTGFLSLIGDQKDSTGRSIFFGDPLKQNFDAYSTQSMIRAAWYILHAALENEDTQRKGLVVLSDLKGASLSVIDHELIRVVALSAVGCIPVRISGLHGCYPPKVFWVIFPILKLLLGERLSQRIKIHSGSKKTVLANLAKYGLESNAHPTEIGGNLVVNMEEWLEKRRSLQL